MYEELRGDLAAWATHFHFNDETSLLLCKAADAIEELQKRLDNAEIENIKLKEEFAKYRGKNRWIPVTERLPPISEEVIVCTYTDMIRIWSLERYHPTVADVIWEREDGYYEDASEVTHWMPLPHPPESEGE